MKEQYTYLIAYFALVLFSNVTVLVQGILIAKYRKMLKWHWDKSDMGWKYALERIMKDCIEKEDYEGAAKCYDLLKTYHEVKK